MTGTLDLPGVGAVLGNNDTEEEKDAASEQAGPLPQASVGSGQLALTPHSWYCVLLCPWFTDKETTRRTLVTWQDHCLEVTESAPKLSLAPWPLSLLAEQGAYPESL